jgi:hypothetical protein
VSAIYMKAEKALFLPQLYRSGSHILIFVNLIFVICFNLLN